MSDEEKYNFGNYMKKAQKELKEFVLEIDQLNSKIKNNILSLQNTDSEIYKLLFNARDFYLEKRNEYNIKLGKLKRQKIEYEGLWNHLTKKIKTLQKPRLNNDISTSIDETKLSIEDVEYKINIMNNKLENQILDIDEENEIIDELKDLEMSKQEKISKLAVLEQKQAKNLQNNDYYKTQIKIETLEKNLREIYEDLIRLFNKRLMTHKKMLDLYRKSIEFEKIKSETEKELIKNETISKEFHHLFLKLIEKNRKILVDELSNRVKSKIPLTKIKTPNIKAIIKKKKKYKRLEKKKLAIALDKQKAGKKLDFYELQLILKHSKKKRV